MAMREQPREEGESALQMNAKPPVVVTPRSLDESLLCLRIRFWWFLTLFFQCFLLILMIACLSTPKWIKQGDYLHEWEGGVVTCSTCTSLSCSGCGSFDNKPYTDLKSAGDCEISDISKAFCAAFDDLGAAGGVYFFFEILSIVLLGVWIAQVALLLLVKECCAKMRWLGYLYPSLALLFHLLALIIWAGISEAKFTGSCENSSFDGSKPKLCATNGPALSVVTVLIYALSVGLFLFAFFKSVPRSDKKQNEEKDTPSQMRLSNEALPQGSPKWQEGEQGSGNFAGFRQEGGPGPRQQGGFAPYQGDVESGAQGPYSDFPITNKV